MRIQYCEKLLKEAGVDHAKDRAFGAYAFVVGANLVPEFLGERYADSSVRVMQLIVSGNLTPANPQDKKTYC